MYFSASSLGESWLQTRNETSINIASGGCLRSKGFCGFRKFEASFALFDIRILSQGRQTDMVFLSPRPNFRASTKANIISASTARKPLLRRLEWRLCELIAALHLHLRFPPQHSLLTCTVPKRLCDWFALLRFEHFRTGCTEPITSQVFSRENSKVKQS